MTLYCCFIFTLSPETEDCDGTVEAVELSMLGPNEVEPLLIINLSVLNVCLLI